MEGPNGLRGGRKRLWLKVHRSEVVAYYEIYGATKTMTAFNLNKDTLDRLLEDSGTATVLSDAEKALLRAEVAEQGLRDCRRDIRELKEQYGMFTEVVSDKLTQKFFSPVLHHILGELPPELVEKPGCTLCLGTLDLPGREMKPGKR